MKKVSVNLQNIEETVLFSGKIYTDDKTFTRPPVATVATNSKSDDKLSILLVFLPIRRHVSRWNDLRESKLKPIFLNSNVKQPVKLNLRQC